LKEEDFTKQKARAVNGRVGLEQIVFVVDKIRGKKPLQM